MKAYLMQKKVWAHAKGATTAPTDPDKKSDWEKEKEQAAGLIWLHLEEGQKSQVVDVMEEPNQVWLKLEAVHVQKRPATRFNAYTNLLNIQKLPEESLPSLTTRIEKAMQEVKNLRDKTFTLESLDSDLQCMSMVRALPTEYESFVSSLSLLPQFDFKTLKEAFIVEENNRKASRQAAAVVAAANAARSPPPPKSIICEFCGIRNHSQAMCRQYKEFQSQARTSAAERQQARRQNRSKPPSSSKPSMSQTTGSSSSEAARTTQDSQDAEEYAGNASITLSDSPLPRCSLSTRWCADTGATSHMTPHRSWFEKYEPCSVPVRVANGTVVKSAGIGSVRFTPVIRGVPARGVVFHRVLHVPALQSNLLSVLYLTSQQRFRVLIDKRVMRFERDGELLFTASQQGQLAYLDGYTSLSSSHSAHSASLLPLTLDLLHRRLGHIGFDLLKRLLSSKVVTGLHLDDRSAPDPVCEPCIAGKQHRIVNKTATRSAVPLAIVHCDLHGPMPVQSIDGGFKYFIVFVDDATRLWAVYFLRSKGDAPQAFYSFKAEIEKQTGHFIKCLHDDKEGGLSSNAFNAKLSEWGIQRRFTMRAEPHSNGVAERAIRSIADAATALLHEGRLPGSFWATAVSTAVHLHNRLPTSANSGITPFELMYKTTPDLSLVRVYGSLAYVHVKKDKRTGFSSHMEKAIFVGYPNQHKGWRFFNPLTRKFVLSDRADFDERVFPGLTTRLPEPAPFPSQPSPNRLESIVRSSAPNPSQPPPNRPESIVRNRPTLLPLDDEDEDTATHKDLRQQVGDPVGDVDANPQEPQPAPNRAPSPPAPQDPAPAPPQPAPVRRSTREKVPAQFWKGNWYKAEYKSANHRVAPDQPLPPFEPPAHLPIPVDPGPYRDPSPAVESESSDEETADLASQSLLFTYVEAMDYIFSEVMHSALGAASHDSPPRSYAEAMRRPDAEKWHEAAHEEIQSLIRNGTWVLAKLPPGRKAIGCRWVFVIKRKSDGTVDRYKARQVAQGFSQRPGFDVFDTYASTLKWPTLRAILGNAALEDLEIESIDISSAFLHGEIDTEIYMKQPEGFPQGSPDHVLRLLKAIYGLRQSPRLWHEKLNTVLVSMGFNKIRSDASVWVFDRDGFKVIVPVFVDDMTLVSKSKAKIAEVKEELKKHFKLRDLGPTEYLLGVKIDRDRSKRILHLSQRQYTIDVLKRYNSGSESSWRPVSTPMDPGLRLTHDQCPQSKEEVEEMRTVPYAHAVGSLMYLAISTRPDIAYSVGVLSRFSSNPGMTHWKAVKHLFRYLQSTLDYKLTYAPDPSSTSLFTTYSDADYAGSKDTGRSTGSYVVKIGTGAVSWMSKLQPVVTLSTTEAEYIAAVSAGTEILWLRKLFTELGYKVASTSSPLFVDNQSALAVAKNPEHHGRMKHLDVRYYWLRDEVEKKTISVSYCPTDQMPADILTKALTRDKVENCCKMLGLTR
jgi:hypothetical protein